ncbi:hypothetical protein [Mycobacterium sp. NPDC050853]|uniref:hypothetical protein n=1 Tax=Mycobacterium sp. NPDC050853 TaxID=3155160 RepID=UPI0033C4988C
MSFEPATPLEETTFEAMYFDGTPARAAETLAMIDSLLTSKKLHYGIIHGFQEVQSPRQWWIKLMRRDASTELVAMAGHWIVVSSTGQVRVLTDADYRAEFSSQ